MERHLAAIRVLVVGVGGLVMLFAGACGDDDDDDASPPLSEALVVAFIEAAEDGPTTLVLVAEDGEARRLELADRIEVQGLDCRASGKVLLAVVQDGALLPPLLLEDGEASFLRSVPQGRAVSWVDDTSFLWQVADEDGEEGIGLYGVDGEPGGALVAGRLPHYLADSGQVAVGLGIEDGPAGPGAYVVDLEAFSGDEADAAMFELLSLIPLNPDQLDPTASRFVLTTAAQENAQRDLQTVEVSGAGLVTIAATPEQEQDARWTAGGGLVFVREALRPQSADPDSPAEAEVVLLDPESGSEEVLAEGAGITDQAPCG